MNFYVLPGKGFLPKFNFVDQNVTEIIESVWFKTLSARVFNKILYFVENDIVCSNLCGEIFNFEIFLIKSGPFSSKILNIFLYILAQNKNVSEHLFFTLKCLTSSFIRKTGSYNIYIEIKSYTQCHKKCMYFTIRSVKTIKLCNVKVIALRMVYVYLCFDLEYTHCASRF